MPEPYDQPIRTVKLSTGIRMKPEMYVGPLDDPATLCRLLFEAMCIALNDGLGGCVNHIDITIHDNGSLSVLDNGTTLDPTKMYDDEKPLLEVIFTEIFACRDHNQHGSELCESGIVSTNALSEWLVYEASFAGEIWQMRFERGELVRPLSPTGKTVRQFRSIHFLPDREIFPSIMLDIPAFQKMFREKCPPLDNCMVQLIHAGVSKTLLPIDEKDSP